MHDLTNAVDIRVGFGMDQARIAITGIASDSLRSQRISFIELESQRYRKSVNAETAHVLLNGLHARFVAESRVRVILRVIRLGWIERGAIPTCNGRGVAEIAVDVKTLFGAGIVGLQIGIGDRPRRRDAALMSDDDEVFCAHAKHGCTIDFRLPTDEVGLLRM